MPKSSETTDIRGARLFPFPFLLLGAGFVLAGIGVIISYAIVGLILIVVGLMMVTAYEGTEVNLARKVYREYNSFLLIKTGKMKAFDEVEKIFINSGKVSQRFYTAHTTGSSAFHNVEYNAYLKFRSGEKIFLFSDRNKNRMLRRTRQIAGALNTSLQDNTAR